MKISGRRSLLSYSKVQHLVGSLIRNQQFHLRSRGLHGLKYLDLGCGWNIHPHVVSVDFQWHPGIDLCWDVSQKGIPFPDRGFQGVFSEHCLEHHRFQDACDLVRECFRVLKPGGVVRYVVPDAEKYLRTYVALLQGERAEFPYPQDQEAYGVHSPLLAVNRIFYQDRESPFGHCTMFDAHLLGSVLRSVGFVDVRTEKFRTGREPALLLDSESRWVESFAIEATRP